MSVNSVIGCLSSLKAPGTLRPYVMVLPYYQSGPRWRNLILPGLASRRREIPAHLSQFIDRPLQVVELGDKGCPTIRDVVRRGLRVEKPAVPRHIQGGGKHFPRHRFLGDAVLQ